jgi:hypothetical protein
MSSYAPASDERFCLQIGCLWAILGVGCCGSRRGRSCRCGTRCCRWGARAAGRSATDRRAAGRSGLVGSDRGALCGRGAPVGPVGGRARPADDRDGDQCAVDGDQAAHGLGLRGADAEVLDSLHLRRFCLIAISERCRTSRRSASSPGALGTSRWTRSSGLVIAKAPRDAVRGPRGARGLDGDRGRHPNGQSSS